MPPLARTAAPHNAQATSDEVWSALIDLLGGCDREADYRQAWAEFERRLGKKMPEGTAL